MTGRIPLKADRLLERLNQFEVEFLVIGGFAVSAHGFPRGTKDLDIVPAPHPDNLSRLADVLVELDADLLGMEEFDADEVVRPDLEGLLDGGNFVLATSLGRLDIMQFVAPDIGYLDLVVAAIDDHVFGQPVRICGYEDLIAMKKAADRPEDRIDIQRLEEARREG